MRLAHGIVLFLSLVFIPPAAAQWKALKGTPAALPPKDAFIFGFLRGLPQPYKAVGVAPAKRSAAFLFETKTTTDDPMTIHLSARIVRTDGNAGPEDWDLRLLHATQRFFVRDRKLATLWVRAGAGVKENDYVQIEVTAERVDGKGTPEAHKVTVTVQMQAYDTRIGPRQRQDRTMSRMRKLLVGRSTRFGLRLTNAGRERDEVEVTISGPEGWRVRVENVRGRPQQVFRVPGVMTFDIRTFTEEPVTVEVTAPDGLAKYDRATFTATARSLKTDRDPETSVSFEAIRAGLLMSVSEAGSPFSERPFRPHLVHPGRITTYILQVANIYDGPRDVRLAITEPRRGAWFAELSETVITDLAPGEIREVRLTVHAPEGGKPGDREEFEVTARAGIREYERVRVAAEISNIPKIYYVAIDAMNYDYLLLDRRGDGPGPCAPEEWVTCESDDWLMPNLHAFIREATAYTNAKNHLLSATDMNHTNALAGTYSGTAGLDSVSGFFFGRDEFGRQIVRDPNRDLMRYGPEGKRVLTIYDVALSQNPNALNVFVGGKNWIGELHRDPTVHRIVHGLDQPIYIAPPPKYFLGDPPSDADAAEDPPARLSVGDISIGAFFGNRPGDFPDDHWVMSSFLRLVENEDPDVSYVLLAGTDDIQHFAGVAWDLDEWIPGDPDTLYDDVSRYNLFASREEVLDVLREADAQFGRLIAYLEERGTYEDAYVVLLSDHGQVTHKLRYVGFRDPLEAVGIDILDDYAENFGGTSMGMLYGMKPELYSLAERAMEGYRVNEERFGGTPTTPWIVLSREEMKNGSYDEATQTAYGVCNDRGRCELYSEFYIEHEEPGISHKWPDFYILYQDHFQAPIYGGVLLSIGLDISIFPEVPILIGGHGSPDTQHIPLILHGPGIRRGNVRDERVHISDIAPTLYRLLDWPVPDNVDGSPLEGALEAPDD
ncbi:MAG: hypothetical protein D6795_10995 [Deltaproteobacteria bacterium]|nr:MAG: hypothetical protein D6795_10995 [Deltaproteobacteria bacterium]